MRAGLRAKGYTECRPVLGRVSPPLAPRPRGGGWVRAGGGGDLDTVAAEFAPGKDRSRALPLLFNLCPARCSIPTYITYENNTHESYTSRANW